jgi:hypothetical protein
MKSRKTSCKRSREATWCGNEASARYGSYRPCRTRSRHYSRWNRICSHDLLEARDDGMTADYVAIEVIRQTNIRKSAIQ